MDDNYLTINSVIRVPFEIIFLMSDFNALNQAIKVDIFDFFSVNSL